MDRTQYDGSCVDDTSRGGKGDKRIDFLVTRSVMLSVMSENMQLFSFEA